MRSFTINGLTYGALIYAEHPLLAQPDSDDCAAECLLSVEDRASIIREAADSGVTLYLASRPGDAASLAQSLDAANSHQSTRIAVEVGHNLNLSPDTKSDGARVVSTDIDERQLTLRGRPIDVAILNNVGQEGYQSDRVAGAIGQLIELRSKGAIGAWGLSSYGDYDCVAELVAAYKPDVVLARCNPTDLGALRLLGPRCEKIGVPMIATQTIAWTKGVPFVRFSNTWRLRNMLKSFYGVSAIQAHTRWLLQAHGVTAVACGINESGQAIELAKAVGDIVKAPPPGMEAALNEFVLAITRSDAGWTDLLTDPYWEYREAAQKLLGPTTT